MTKNNDLKIELRMGEEQLILKEINDAFQDVRRRVIDELNAIDSKAKGAFETANTALGDTTKLLVEHKRLNQRIESIEKRLKELELKKEASEEAKTENLDQPENNESIAQDCVVNCRTGNLETESHSVTLEVYLCRNQDEEHIGSIFVKNERPEKICDGGLHFFEASTFILPPEFFPEINQENDVVRARIKIEIIKENSEKPNFDEDFFDEASRLCPEGIHQTTYPSHWPRKADGSGVEVGEPIEVLTLGYKGDWYKTKIKKIDGFRIYVGDYDHWYYDKIEWEKGFQFRLPKKQPKESDMYRALELLEKIRRRILEIEAYSMECNEEFKELRQLLGGE